MLGLDRTLDKVLGLFFVVGLAGFFKCGDLLFFSILGCFRHGLLFVVKVDLDNDFIDLRLENFFLCFRDFVEEYESFTLFSSSIFELVCYKIKIQHNFSLILVSQVINKVFTVC